MTKDLPSIEELSEKVKERVNERLETITSTEDKGAYAAKYAEDGKALLDLVKEYERLLKLTQEKLAAAK